MADCESCARLEAEIERLRDRIGTVELINEGLAEKVRRHMDVPANTDIEGRVAVLMLDRMQRRLRKLQGEQGDL